MNREEKLSVALVQVDAGSNVEANLQEFADLVSGLENIDLVAVPEVFSFRGSDLDYQAIAEPLDGEVVSFTADLAKKMGCWILAGSVIEKDGDKRYNTSVLLDRSGEIAATYRKMHLFEACLDDGSIVRESDSYDPGETPVVAEIEGWKAGLSICYDLRFPELYRQYSASGACIMFVPADFTQNTGKDHWETLVRARAIENQCFVVAPNQCGENPATGVESYGNSMVVGPWGDVLCRADGAPSVLTADLILSELENTRGRIPALKQRKL